MPLKLGKLKKTFRKINLRTRGKTPKRVSGTHLILKKKKKERETSLIGICLNDGPCQNHSVFTVGSK